jgi:hypothetical protein
MRMGIVSSEIEYCRTALILIPSLTTLLAISTPPGITRSAVANVKASGAYARLNPVAVLAVPWNVNAAVAFATGIATFCDGLPTTALMAGAMAMLPPPPP